MTDKERILALELRVNKLRDALTAVVRGCISHDGCLADGQIRKTIAEGALAADTDDTSVVGVLREVEETLDHASKEYESRYADPYMEEKILATLTKLRVVLREK